MKRPDKKDYETSGSMINPYGSYSFEAYANELEKYSNYLESKVENLGIHSVVFNEADNICKTCNKPIRMQNGILQQLCECNSEVEVLPMENCPKCGKLRTGRSCHDCQQYW